ncbi:MAG: NAD(P)-binding domain-containing protein [Candidatus Heimdallarchaeota archaeon]|nr:NAD(P)-binding domain-containing protein [Candidatus Heimdallarchaeota archaeon]
MVRPTLAELIKEHKNFLSKNVEILTPNVGSDDEIAQMVVDAEIIVCTRLSPEIISKTKKLKLIQKTGAGVDAIPFEVIEKDVYVANTSGANPVPIAEGAIALLMSLAKRIVHRHNLFPERDSQMGTEIRGKKLGIIGLGSIGVEIAKRMSSFEMNILAIKRQPTEELKEKLGIEFLGSTEDLDYLLAESDFIILTVPLTPQTRGLIGERELQLMKATAYVINVGRAALIQEEPFYKALKEGRIAGAGIDVWWIPHWWDPIWSPNEDKPANYPIWELPNVIATPHNIGFTEKTIHSDNALKIIIENINRIEKGLPPINLVDKEFQY